MRQFTRGGVRVSDVITRVAGVATCVIQQSETLGGEIVFLAPRQLK
ncbi:hypothetical protein chiPu_0028496, partial [Chiloscyllium punctatum]|nr:hypothetical protein [Chiloscyllium punctatum]